MNESLRVCLEPDSGSVPLNGVEVCTFTAPAYKPRAGRIGLQAHHAGSRVQFRAPRLQRL